MIFKLSIAPMYNYTDIHCYYFYNLLNKNIKFYIGMIHTSSLLKNFYKYKLLFSKLKNNIVIQLVGNNYKDIYESVKLIKNFSIYEINFNVGCPSIHAKNGKFGVYLMNNIIKVINCIKAIEDVIDNNKIISLKTRIALYDYNYNYFLDFIGKISLLTSCKYFIIHSRGILKDNIYTKLNLVKPFINYKFVYNIKKDLPHLIIIINGNINNIFDIKRHLLYVDGVMMGRGIYFNPLLLIKIKKYLYKNIYKYKNNFFIKNNDFFYQNGCISKYVLYIFYKLYFYILKQNKKYNINPWCIIRHVIHIFYDIKNASFFRNRLILCSKKFKNFLNYNEFLYFIFKGFI